MASGWVRSGVPTGCGGCANRVRVEFQRGAGNFQLGAEGCGGDFGTGFPLRFGIKGLQLLNKWCKWGSEPELGWNFFQPGSGCLVPENVWFPAEFGAWRRFW